MDPTREDPVPLDPNPASPPAAESQIPDGLIPPAAEDCPQLNPVPPPSGPVEILPPTQVWLKVESDCWGGRKSTWAAVALTSDTLWIQYVWRQRQVPLHSIGSIEARRWGRKLILRLGEGATAEKLTLVFASFDLLRRWQAELESRRLQPPPEVATGDAFVPEGVALVRNAPDVAWQQLGRVSCLDKSDWLAHRGAQLRAGMMGADAVVDVARQKLAGLGEGWRLTQGVAIRCADKSVRDDLRRVWYREEVVDLVGRMLLLLVVQTGLIFLAVFVCASPANRLDLVGKSLPARVLYLLLGQGVLIAWPLLLILALRFLQWPLLLRVTGLALLAATAGRGLVLMAAQVLAALLVRGSPSAQTVLGPLIDPIEWGFVVVGGYLCLRAFELARNVPEIAPQTASSQERIGSWIALGTTGLYALLLAAGLFFARFDATSQLLEPGADPVRELAAANALDRGLAELEKNNLPAAEASLTQSLREWETLTAPQVAPAAYRVNLICTLNNLAKVRSDQGKLEEAEKLAARAVAAAELMAKDSDAPPELQSNLTYARDLLKGVRRVRSSRQVIENDKTACRRFEEGQIKAQKDPIEAEKHFRAAIAIWEELLPTFKELGEGEYALLKLASAHLIVGELLVDTKRGDAETALKKSVDYGEQAQAIAPDRPLAKHNTEVARRMLDGLREQALCDEIDKACAAGRYAEAIDRFVSGIEEQEAQLAATKDREGTQRRLAFRLDHFARFLAHCPDARIRDTKAAVKRAKRATELQPDDMDYWFTLATAQYRNGDWRDSLASFDRIKAKPGGHDAMDWLLIAMNRHQLKQQAEAKDALRNASNWIAEIQNQAEDNPALRIRFEFMRPQLDALRREAESLIQGKDGGEPKVG